MLAIWVFIDFEYGPVLVSPDRDEIANIQFIPKLVPHQIPNLFLSRRNVISNWGLGTMCSAGRPGPR